MQEPFPTETNQLIPEKLSNEVLGKLISAIGNHENKALLCAAMAPGIVYSRNDLQTLFNGIQGNDPAWPANDSLAFSYCLESLAPIGFVAKEIINQDRGTVGFIKTETGEKLGEAISGHLLDFSLAHPNISLQQVFGRTGTSAQSGTRAPMVRIDVFGELLTRKQPIRVSDVIDSSSSALASHHIGNLVREGLITAKRRYRSDDVAEYALGSFSLDAISLRPGRSKLPSDIREILAERLITNGIKSITASQIIPILKLKNPAYIEADQAHLTTQIHQALRLFAGKGAIIPAGDFTNDKRSVITLTEEQEAMLSDCLGLVYDIQDLNEDFIKQGRDKARAIVNNSDLVKTLVSKAREKSPFANRKSRAETAASVQRILEAQPGLTVTEIEQHLEGNLTKDSIRDVLRNMEKGGLAQKNTRDKKVAWFVIHNAP